MNIILYAPTYRENGSVFFFPDFDKGRSQKFIKEHNILFIVKLHPLEEAHTIKIFKKMENIILLEDQMLQERHLDIYDFFPCTDILVTNYSSVYFDFLLLDKPILFAVPDLEEYRKKRSFVLEPFEFWAPGPKVKNFKKFLEEIKKSIEPELLFTREKNHKRSCKLLQG